MEATMNPASPEFQHLTGGEVRIVCCGSGKVLDVEGGDGNAEDHVIQFQRHDGRNQRWRLVCVNMETRLFEIQSPFCGLVADVYAAAMGRGAHLIVFNRHGGENQRFVLEKAKIAGEYFIRAWHSSLVLDVQGGSDADCTQIIQWERHGGANQRFRIERYN